MQQDVVDLNHAVQIAPRVWWVGHVLENDPFQYVLSPSTQTMIFGKNMSVVFISVPAPQRAWLMRQRLINRGGMI